MSDFPSSKMERGKILAKTGLKVGSNYARYFMRRAFSGNDAQQKQQLNEDNARHIFQEFSKLRGTALKLAQSMSMDTGVLPEEYIDIMSNAQYRVPPINRALVRAIIKQELGKYPEMLFRKFDGNAIAAASIGQVHRATLKDGREAAVKIQYPNVRETIKSDLTIAKAFFKRLVRSGMTEEYFEEVYQKLLEETDYINEGRQIERFAELKLHPKVITPRYVPELSTERVLTMTFVEGVHLDVFLQRNPSQAQRDYFGQILWEFFNEQINHHSYTLYADIHPGNFLFREDGLLGVLDFGCVKTFPPAFLEDCLLMFDANIREDEPEIKRLYYQTGILNPAEKGSDKEAYMFDFFRGLGGLILEPFQHEQFDFGDPDYKTALNAYFREAAQMNEARGSRHFIFLSKVLIGLYAMLMKLQARVETQTSKRVLTEAVREINRKRAQNTN
jgi:predicted unusual protein kinase regulating ubiquinone biosynthesis (AarF/ABC1/UbiB family)